MIATTTNYTITPEKIDQEFGHIVGWTPLDEVANLFNRITEGTFKPVCEKPGAVGSSGKS